MPGAQSWHWAGNRVRVLHYTMRGIWEMFQRAIVYWALLRFKLASVLS